MCDNSSNSLEYVFDNVSYADSNELKQSVCQESNFNKCDDIIYIKQKSELSECKNSNDDGYYEKMNKFEKMGFWCDDMCKFHQPRTSNCVEGDSEIYFDINGTINDREGLSRSYSNMDLEEAQIKYMADICWGSLLLKPMMDDNGNQTIDMEHKNRVCESNIRITNFNYTDDNCDNHTKFSTAKDPGFPYELITVSDFCSTTCLFT